MPLHLCGCFSLSSNSLPDSWRFLASRAVMCLYAGCLDVIVLSMSAHFEPAARHHPASCRPFLSPLLLLKRLPQLCSVCPYVVLRRQTVPPIVSFHTVICSFPLFASCNECEMFSLCGLVCRSRILKVSRASECVSTSCVVTSLYTGCLHAIPTSTSSCIRHRFSNYFQAFVGLYLFMTSF